MQLNQVIDKPLDQLRYKKPIEDSLITHGQRGEPSSGYVSDSVSPEEWRGCSAVTSPY